MFTASLEEVKIVAQGFGPLVNEIVFLGGALTGIYATTSAAPESRPSIDVDCIIRVASRSEYASLEEKLRMGGFSHDVSPGAPLCRWIYRGIPVDIMPTDPAILGFSNRWYENGIVHAVSVDLLRGLTIRILSAVYFVATKIEACRARGLSDLRTSSDFDDIVYVLDNRSEFGEELLATELEVRLCIVGFCANLLALPDLDEAIAAVLPYGSRAVKRIRGILAALAVIT